MTTMQELIDTIEASLADQSNTTWAVDDIEQWTRDAIRDYGMHFPLRKIQTLSTSLNDNTYDLAADFIDIVYVEYPTGQDPRELLKRRPISHPQFWTQEGYYDIVPNQDDTNVNELWISTDPAASEGIDVYYDAQHSAAIALPSTTAITIPDRHLHIVRQYVIWQAILQRANTEHASPTSNSSLLMSQLMTDSERARRGYVDLLAKALFALQRSAAVSWKNQIDATTRIY
jgi:hypothetical protein